jgi:urease accessory protein
MSTTTLQLLYLADSAFPIGATAHSFGLETLTSAGVITPAGVEPWLRDWLVEVGLTEAMGCRLAYRLAAHELDEYFVRSWFELNLLLAALKPAREGRTASATLGRHFLQMVAMLNANARCQLALERCRQEQVEIHHCVAFGLVGGCLGLGERESVLAYLQQSVTAFLAACQRLLPFGQNQAIRVAWRLQPAVEEMATESGKRMGETDKPSPYLLLDRLSAFAPMLEIAGMRHPTLTTRLFIS